MREGWKIAGTVALLALLGADIGLQVAFRFSPPFTEAQQTIHPEGGQNAAGAGIKDYSPLILGALTLIVLVFQTFIFNRQARIAQSQTRISARQTAAMNRQTAMMSAQTDLMIMQKEIARRTFIAAHRPRMHVQFIDSPHITTGNKPTATIRVINIGGSDAKVIGIGIAWFRRSSDGAEINAWNAIPQPLPQGEQVVPPGKQLDIGVDGSTPLSEADIDAIHIGQHELIMVAILTYEDEVGASRATSFVRRFVNHPTRPHYVRLAEGDAHLDYEYEY
jgi:hypothetical protein